MAGQGSLVWKNIYNTGCVSGRGNTDCVTGREITGCVSGREITGCVSDRGNSCVSDRGNSCVSGRECSLSAAYWRLQWCSAVSSSLPQVRVRSSDVYIIMYMYVV